MRRCLLIIVQSEVIDNEETKGISENWMMHWRLLLSLFIKYRKDEDAKSAEKLGGQIKQMEIKYI